MITTARGTRAAGGGRARSRRVTLPDFDAFWAEEDVPDGRHQAYLGLLRYGIDHCLTPRQRQAVELYYYGGKTLEEAARELGVAPSTVCRHLQAARGRLGDLAARAGELQKLGFIESTCFLGGQAL